MKDSDEFSILKKVFKNLGNHYFDSSNILLGPGDDAGLFKSKTELIFSTEVSVEKINSFFVLNKPASSPGPNNKFEESKY